VNLGEDRFRSYMGDEESWVGLVDDFWLELSRADTGRALTREDGRSTQVWTGLLHLMYLGLGWQNPGLGLEQWRKTNYRKGLHPVLDVAWRVAGENLIALEIFLKNISLEMRGTEGPFTGFGVNLDLESDESWANEVMRQFTLTKLGDDILPFGGWDPLHLSNHLEDSFRKSSSSCDIAVVFENKATLVTDKYAGWHHHFKSVDEELNRLGMLSSEVELGVKVIGMVKLGDFRYCDLTSLWYLTTGGESEEIAHLWGNSATSQPTSTGTFVSSDSSQKDRSQFLSPVSMDSMGETRQLSFLVRQEVGLAHSFEQEITTADGETRSWFYKRGVWDSGAEWENSSHFNECLLALLESNNIDPEMTILESVLDGSLIVNIKPWAEELATNIWECSSKFPHFLAQLMTLDEHEAISIRDLELFMADQVVSLRDNLAKRAKRAKELYFISGVQHFVESGERMGAGELLESIAEAYEYFGDD